MQTIYYILTILIKCAINLRPNVLDLRQSNILKNRLDTFQQQINAISTLNNVPILQYLDTFSYIVTAYGNAKLLELMKDSIEYFKTYGTPVEHSTTENIVLHFVYTDICKTSVSPNKPLLEQIRAYIDPYYAFLLILKEEKKYSYISSDKKQLTLAYAYLGADAVQVSLKVTN